MGEGRSVFSVFLIEVKGKAEQSTAVPAVRSTFLQRSPSHTHSHTYAALIASLNTFTG